MKMEMVSAVLAILVALCSAGFFLFRAGRFSRDIEGNLERKIDAVAQSVSMLTENLCSVNERIMRIETILLRTNGDRE